MSLRPTDEETRLGRLENEHLEDLAFMRKQMTSAAEDYAQRYDEASADAKVLRWKLSQVKEENKQLLADKKRLIGIIFKLDAKLAESLESIQDK